MPKSWNKTETWVTALVIIVGLVPLGVGALWMFMSATTRPLHPDAQDVPSVLASTPAAEWAAAVTRGQQIARAGLSEHNLPGLSVAVGAGGQLVWAESFGWADVERRVTATPDTPFRIGTASTALTSAAVGLLLERDRMTLDEDIQAYVPAFPEKPWPVTLRQLMGHTAGLRPDEGDEEPVRVRCPRPTDALPHFADAELLFAPGTDYRYSSYGWVLVSAAIEAAENAPFADVMQREVFTPLGLAHTSLDGATPPRPTPAVFYFPRFAADPRYGAQAPEPIDSTCLAGAAALLSTPSDLVRFITALNRGTWLRPATVQLLQGAQQLPSGRDTGYGLGWGRETVDLGGQPTPVISIEGTLRGGPVSSFLTVPGSGLVVAVTSNTAFADTTAIALSVARAFTDQR